jgi:Uma2 family endonuclease
MLSGVKEYWLADPVRKTIMIYGFNNLDVEEFISYKADEVAASQVFEGLEAPLAEVFVF